MKFFVQSLKRYFQLKYLFRTMLICASTHLIILYVLSAIRGDYHLINLFTVLGFSEIFPSLGQGIVNFWLSNLMAAIIYAGVVIFSLRKKQR